MTDATRKADANIGTAARTLSSFRRVPALAFAVILWCGLAPASAAAQASFIPSNAQNAVDYRERTEARVDPATGALQFQIQLGSYKGRGGLDLPVTLYYSSKVWDIRHLGTIMRGSGCTGCEGEPDSIFGGFFGLHSAAGWTSNLDWFKWGEPVTFETYDESGRACDSGCTARVARLFLTTPDGSRHEFRRDDQIYSFGANVLNGTYYSVDGSRLRYEVSSGTLYLPDGSRYLTGQDEAGFHLRHYIDRHGNRLSYEDSTKQWVDTLGRTYGLPPLDTSASADRTYWLPGIGVSSRQATFVWRRLADVRTDPNQPLHYVGDRTTTYPHTEVTPSLFHSPDLNQSMVDGYNGQPFNPVVLHKIVLPNQTAYTFTYNVYGEIDKVVYPTGGYEKFSYGTVDPISAHVFDLSPGPQANRGVKERRVSAKGDSTDEAVWGYNPGPTALVTAPDGTRTETYHHVSDGSTVLYGFDNPLAGRAYEERVVSASGQLLRRKLTHWTADGPTETRGSYVIHKKRNPRVTKEVSIILDTTGDALTATTEYGYDSDLNPEKVERYGYRAVPKTTAATASIGAFQSGDLLRVEETDYLTDDQNYRERHLLGLPKVTRIKNGAGAVLAETKYHYDEPAFSPFNCGASVGRSDPNTEARGNVTSTEQWLSTTGGWLKTHARYDRCGNLRQSWDAEDTQLENPSEISYEDDFASAAGHTTFAYPTSVKTPVPDADGSNGSNTALETKTRYDYQTGLAVESTDANNRATLYFYTDEQGTPDPLSRLRKVQRPDGGWTKYEYGDSPGSHYVHTQKALDGVRVADSYQYLDGLGRPARAYAEDGSGSARQWSVTKTQYDALGRPWKVSNPLFAAGLDDFIPPAGAVTTTEYDALGRVKRVTTPDGASTVAEHSNDRVTVTDQAGKMRRSVSDALGRLIQVTEPNDAGSLDAPDSPVTSYEYDVLGNLTKVVQGGQTRTFVYDSLSRLILVRNPEQEATLTDARATGQWSLSYVYDARGNLKERTDARQVRTAYDYDGLGRVLAKTFAYVGPGAAPAAYAATPSANYFYDGTGMPEVNNLPLPVPNDSKGRLTAVKSLVSEAFHTEFDVMGRVKKHRQVSDPNSDAQQTYAMEYSYDLAGNLVSQQYPSGKVVVTEYDQVGRFSGMKNEQTGLYYAGGPLDGDGDSDNNPVQYAAHGAVSAMRLGNGLWEHTSFNSRLQPGEIGLGTSSTNSSLLRLDYSYGTTNNNGTVRSQRIVVQGQLDLTQSYTYDELNRLKTVEETGGTTSPWKQVYTYDRFGNRGLGGGTTTPDLSANLAKLVNPTISAVTNRIIEEQDGDGVKDYGYDAAGNLVCDPQHPCGTAQQSVPYYTYDGEGRMKSSGGGASAGGSDYTYDGDGRRVKKVADAVTTVFVYNALGQLVAEYANVQPQANGTSYLTRDHLGSTRVVTDKDGQPKSRHDYLPFGEEIKTGTGGRASGQGYNLSDKLRQKFTGYERDIETDLDYAQARYYSSGLGRFTSPDDFLNDTHISNPQSWNLYVYVRNNPLIFIDPTGMRTDIVDCNTGKITRIDDGKDQVLVASTAQINALIRAISQFYYWRMLKSLEESRSHNLHMTRADFMKLAKTIYAESRGGYEESFGIVNVLENRAAADGNDLMDQLTKDSPYGVYGVDSKAYDTQTGTAADQKRANVHMAIANARTTDIDLSKGAYFWDGKDFDGKANKTGGHRARYKPGYLFTDSRHDLWGQGNNPVNGTYKYQSTQALGSTTFSKLYSQGEKWYVSKSK
jgi:RHS repeat-associated protein